MTGNGDGNDGGSAGTGTGTGNDGTGNDGSAASSAANNDGTGTNACSAAGNDGGGTGSARPRPGGPRRIFGVERTKAFVDAVVAIAMTLLILPLMESIGEAAGTGDDAATWVGEHTSQLVSFALSFVIIAMFWMNHHRLFLRVTHISSALMWLLMAWSLSIVWLPVATALSGQMASADPVAEALYIGSMVATSLLSLGIRAYLRAHPAAHDASRDALLEGMSVDISMAVLFSIALALSLVFPPVGYFSLFVMLLMDVVQRVFERFLGVPRRSRNSEAETREAETRET